MTAKNPVPARLFVLLAREAPIGVILRRGPTDWVQMIHWDTKQGKFTPGQWFHGRIFEHRCDLSPNGKLFVYRAFKPLNRLKNPDYGDSWTAVSKPPRFTALALWPLWNGSVGGGFFFEHGKMLLNHALDNRDLHHTYRLPMDLEVKTIETYEDETDYMGNDIHYHAMLRDGWKTSKRFVSSLKSFSMSDKPPKNDLAVTLEKTKEGITLICRIYNQHHFTMYPKKHKRVFAEMQHLAKTEEKDSRFGNYLQDFIRKPYHSTISHRYQYAIKMPDGELELSDVTWADFDRSRRLLLAKEGKIFSAIVQNGEIALTELADFNENVPEPIRKKRGE